MNRHNHVLREILKFTSGLITADFFVGLWLYSSNLLPFKLWGITYTPSTMIGGMIFDIIILVILVHYAWQADIHAPSLQQRSLFMIVGIIMGVVALAHLLRALFGIEVIIAGWTLPLWLSWVGALVALYISYSSFRFALHKR